jgi:hypothetical protein
MLLFFMVGCIHIALLLMLNHAISTEMPACWCYLIDYSDLILPPLYTYFHFSAFSDNVSDIFFRADTCHRFRWQLLNTDIHSRSLSNV